MKIKMLYTAPGFCNCYVIQTMGGEYAAFFDTPARKITEKDLRPVKAYRSEGRAGEEAPPYIYKMYGLEKKET